MEWVDESMKTNSIKHVFILTHAPMYSTGSFGSEPYFTHKLEYLLDRHPNIKAVFAGHDHIFSAFKRNNTMIMVNGCGGGALGGMKKGRIWNETSYHGEMLADDDQRIGYNYHLDSSMIYSKTEVTIGEEEITYRIINLEMEEQEYQYIQNIV